MTLTHICIIGAFILIGSLGLAVLQQACADCFRHTIGRHKKTKPANMPFARTRLT